MDPALSPSQAQWMLTIVVAIPLAVLVRHLISPAYDPREPPVIKPKIPLIGHIISIATEASGYYQRLFKKYRLPICTLPVLNYKIYVINSPALIAAAQRSKTLSFEVFIRHFFINVIGVPQRESAKFADPKWLATVSKPLAAGLSGESLREIAAVGLGGIARELNAVTGEKGVRIGDVEGWLTDMLSRVIMRALYGEKNPLSVEVHRSIWEFDKKIFLIALGLAPKLFARKALAARDEIQKVLAPFYLNRLDEGEDVSAYVRNRAATKRATGTPSEDLAATEFDVAWASVTNTTPTMIWTFVSIFSRPDVVERIRTEVLSVTTIDNNTATIDYSRLQEQPFLNACWQEILRLYNDGQGTRFVIEDTVLRDADGQEYLLKKGAVALWTVGVSHLNDDIWGADAHEFRPERWLGLSPAEEKKQKGAMFPFGGGKHLCPGRMFAAIEIIGFVGAVALAFEVEDVTVPEMLTPYPGAGVRRWKWGPGGPGEVRLRRRKGWETMEIKFSTEGGIWDNSK